MKSRKIIIADQHSLFREGFRRVIVTAGNALVMGEATNSGELLDLIESNLPDVLFLETRLPGEDTVQLVDRIHFRYPGIEIYAMSSYDNFRYVSLMKNAGASGYISKNLNNQDLIRKIIRGNIKFFIQPEPHRSGQKPTGIQ